MRISKIVVEYQASRSENYQSVRVGASVEVQVEEGDELKDVFLKSKDWVAKRCNEAAEDEIQRLLLGMGR